MSTPWSILLHGARALRQPSQRVEFKKALGHKTVDCDGRRLRVIPLQILPNGWDRHYSALAMKTALKPWLRSMLGFLGGVPDVVILDQVKLEPLIDLFPSSRLVFRPTDIPRVDGERVGFQRIAARADGIVVTSESIFEDAWRGSRSLTLSNGVDFRHFDRVSTGPRSGLIYVGAIDDRFDWSWLLSAAAALPRESIDIWGPVETAIPSLPPNVALKGVAQYAQLPDLLARARIGLMPFIANDLNVARSPMKLYEYLAAGLKVVCAAPGPSVAEGVIEVYTLSMSQLAGNLPRIYAVPVTAGGKVAASEYSWERRANMLEAFLTSVVAGPSRSSVGER